MWEKKIQLSLALPSNKSLKEKQSIIERANVLKIGIYLSDIPKNHDLFQLINNWATEFLDIPHFGTAIISPLLYNIENLKNSIKTMFELNKIELNLGLGIGDKNLIKMNYNNSYSIFQEKISSLLSDSQIKERINSISIAGSGINLLKFSEKLNLGFIFNGIPDQSLIENINKIPSRKNFSSFIMVDINSYDNLSKGFISIVTRILRTLPKSEQSRLNVSLDTINIINENALNNNLDNYHSWLPRSEIEKVALFGTTEDILSKIDKLKPLQLKHVIVSLSEDEIRKELLDFIQDNKLDINHL